MILTLIYGKDGESGASYFGAQVGARYGSHYAAKTSMTLIRKFGMVMVGTLRQSRRQ